MDRRSLPLIIIVALASGAAGWFLHTPPAEAEKTASAATTANAEPAKAAPATVSPTAKVAAPTAAPAPVSSPVVVSAPPPDSPAPMAPGVTPPELANVIVEMNNLVQSGDLVSLYENYEPPQKMAALTPEQKSFLENQIRQQTQGPNGPRVIQGQLAIMQALGTATPVLNSAGDHATYQIPTPKDLAPAGTNLPPTIPVNFVKIDGKWYLDQ